MESLNITPRIGLHDSADTQEADTESVIAPPYSPVSVTTCEEVQDLLLDHSCMEELQCNSETELSSCTEQEEELVIYKAYSSPPKNLGSSYIIMLLVYIH